MEKAYEQLPGYMESNGAEKGYLLTFDFHKGKNRKPKARWTERGGRMIFDAVV